MNIHEVTRSFLPIKQMLYFPLGRSSGDFNSNSVHDISYSVKKVPHRSDFCIFRNLLACAFLFIPIRRLPDTICTLPRL